MNKRISEIQGLRALATILVIIFHAKFVGGGFIGVDIFYVISGFLISGLLFKEISETDGLRFGRFYLRRLKRLLPTSSFVLIVTAIASWVLLSPITRASVGRDVVAVSTYICNYLFAFWENDYQNLGAIPSPFIHYWSLAVEEQFYLLLPALFFLLSRLRNKQSLLIGVWISTIASFIYSVFLTQSAPIWAFYSLPTRAWELGAGALIALTPKIHIKKPMLMWIAVLGLLFATLRFNSSTAFPGVAALVPVLATMLLIAGVGHWPPILHDAAHWPISQWLGKISYPLYLWHWPLLVLPAAYLGRPLHVFERLLCIFATVVSADLTNRFIEDPLRLAKLKPLTIISGALLATLLSTALGVAIHLTGTSTIKVTGQKESFSLAHVTRKPDVYSNGCHVNYGKSVSPSCEFGDLQANKTIVLYGDSHAAQWFPTFEALAKQEHFKLISLTKSACPSIEVARRSRGPFNASECDTWRSNSLKRIASIKPDSVIISSFQWYAPEAGTGSRQEWWSKGELKVLEKLTGSTQKIIYISDTPHVLRDIPACLAAGKTAACNSSQPSFANAPTSLLAINPTPWLCNQKCDAIVNNVIAYRDGSHISVDLALFLEQRMKIDLQKFGVL